MQACIKGGLSWRWVYTAQHKETIQNSLDTFKLPAPDYTVMKWSTEAKTIGSMGKWLGTVLLALLKGKKILAGFVGKQHIVLTHGDTFSTWWGALLGKLNGCRVMHVEAGLRSFNLFKPFPEEINRLITFRLSDYYACPGDWACDNLAKYKGEKINTQMNTQIDALNFGIKLSEKSDFHPPKTKYVVASVHRYENIFNQDRFNKIIDLVELIAREYKVLFVQHPATAVQIEKLNLGGRFEKIRNLILLPRLEYLQFLKAVNHSEFVATDGGGNQEELYFMGKPTLLFRAESERQEGLGDTAVLSKYRVSVVKDFIQNYRKYSRPPVSVKTPPSERIVGFLKGKGYGKA